MLLPGRNEFRPSGREPIAGLLRLRLEPRTTALHAEFAERRKFFTEYMPFWRLEYDVFHGIRGIRVEYVRNTGRWEVIWNTSNTYSACRFTCLCTASWSPIAVGYVAS